MSVYKAPQKEFAFLFQELVNYAEHSQMPGYDEVGSDMVEAIIPEAAKFFEQEVAPNNWQADTQPAHLKDGQVITAPMLAGAYQQMVEAGWCGISGNPKYDGAGFPGVVDVAVQEMLQSANMGFSLLPMLTRGVIHALNLYGSDQ